MKVALFIVISLVLFVVLGFLGQWLTWEVIPYLKDKAKERKMKKLDKKLQKTLDKIRKS